MFGARRASFKHVRVDGALHANIDAAGFHFGSAPIALFLSDVRGVIRKWCEHLAGKVILDAGGMNGVLRTRRYAFHAIVTLIGYEIPHRCLRKIMIGNGLKRNWKVPQATQSRIVPFGE